MGWKTVKERFEIKDHIVQISGDEIHIGSGYVSDLVRIKLSSGNIAENRTFRGFLYDKYPLLAEATPEEVLDAIQAEDHFSNSIPVYTYDKGVIIKKYCEELGWPNTTHDGDVMYENMFSTDEAEVVAWAKRDSARQVEVSKEQIQRLRDQIKEWEERMQEGLDEKVELDRKYPDVQSA